jgi:hypothetical protein
MYVVGMCQFLTPCQTDFLRRLCGHLLSTGVMLILDSFPPWQFRAMSKK